MVQNIKKYFKNFLLISGGILMASCNTKPIENEQFDYSKYPLYNENVDSIEYKFNDKEISDPFYKGNVVYNESVLLTKDDETGEISGNLMFKPTKILAVKDYTLKTKDYRQVDEVPGYSEDERQILLKHLQSVENPDIYDYAIILMFCFTVLLLTVGFVRNQSEVFVR